MGKMSEKQILRRRENRRKKRVLNAKERQLSSKNEFGISDPTPKTAIDNIIREVKMKCETN